MRTTTSSQRDDVTGAGAVAGSGSRGAPPAQPAGAVFQGPALGAARSLRARLPGDPRAAADARQFVRTAFDDWAAQGLPGADGLTGRLADEAVLLVSELVTNAVVHAGTAVELRCRLEPGVPEEPTAAGSPQASGGPGDGGPAAHAGAQATEGALPEVDTEEGDRAGVVIEVSDHHPARPVRARAEDGAAPRGRRARPAAGQRGRRVLGHHLPPGHEDRVVPPARRDAGGRRAARAGVFFDHQMLQRELRAAEILGPGAAPAARQHPTRTGSTTARCPSSPRPPTCSPASSTPTRSPRSPPS